MRAPKVRRLSPLSVRSPNATQFASELSRPATARQSTNANAAPASASTSTVRSLWSGRWPSPTTTTITPASTSRTREHALGRRPLHPTRRDGARRGRERGRRDRRRRRQHRSDVLRPLDEEMERSPQHPRPSAMSTAPMYDHSRRRRTRPVPPAKRHTNASVDRAPDHRHGSSGTRRVRRGDSRPPQWPRRPRSPTIRSTRAPRRGDTEDEPQPRRRSGDGHSALNTSAGRIRAAVAAGPAASALATAIATGTMRITTTIASGGSRRTGSCRPTTARRTARPTMPSGTPMMTPAVASKRRLPCDRHARLAAREPDRPQHGEVVAPTPYGRDQCVRNGRDRQQREEDPERERQRPEPAEVGNRGRQLRHESTALAVRGERLQPLLRRIDIGPRLPPDEHEVPEVVGAALRDGRKRGLQSRAASSTRSGRTRCATSRA